jgi:uncharacterized protein YlxP (DUF503 family)
MYHLFLIKYIIQRTFTLYTNLAVVQAGTIMKVLISKIELRIPQAASLKDKAVLGLVYVSNDKPLLESVMNKIVNLVETSYPGLLHTYEYTIEYYG